MGRPRIDIDQKGFEKLCALQCTLREVAAFFDVSEDTIERWCKRTYKRNFCDVFEEKKQIGLISLRRNQFKLAERNAAMAKHLGINYLGQTDAHRVEVARADDDAASYIDAYLAAQRSGGGGNGDA